MQLVSTQEVADILSSYLERNREPRAVLARRAGVDEAVLRRVLTVRYKGTSVSLADKLLDAAFSSVDAVPSYWDEGWTDRHKSDRIAERTRRWHANGPRWNHGTHYGYLKGCRCDDCLQAKAEYQIWFNAYQRRQRVRRKHPALRLLQGG